MNKKMAVIVVLSAMQSAHASFFEAFLKYTGIQSAYKLCATIVAKNGSRKSIMAASPVLPRQPSVLQENLGEQTITALSHALYLENNMLEGNIIIRTHNKQNEVIIEPTAYGSSTEITNKLSYIPEIKEGVLYITCRDNNVTPKQKSSWVPFFAFWRKTKTEITTEKMPYGLHFVITVPQVYDIKTKSKGCVSITNDKDSKDKPNIGIIGTLNIETSVGNINVQKWKLPAGKATTNSLKINGMGAVHTNVPDNTVVTWKNSQTITHQDQPYKKPSFTKGSNAHKLEIDTVGRIDLDPTQKKQ